MRKNIVIIGSSRSILLWKLVDELKHTYPKIIIGHNVLPSIRHFKDPNTLVIVSCKKVPALKVPYTLYYRSKSRKHSKIDPSLPSDIYTITEFV